MEARCLQAGGWQPDNLARIQAALTALPPQNERPGPLAAVFDFDNTSVFRDIGQAVFRLQAQKLRFRLAPEAMAALIPAGGDDIDGRPWQAAWEALLVRYREIWPLLAEGKNEAAQQHQSGQEFAALLYWLITSARTQPTLGPRFVLSFLAKVQAAYTVSEQRAFCAGALAGILAEPLEMREFSAHLPAPLNEIRASYPIGFRPFLEIQDLMRVLQAHGLRVCIVSASSEWLVQEAAPKLGFPLEEKDIFGVRARLGANGLILPEDAPNWPLTWRAGKNEVVDRHIRATPWLVAGDADTDYELLTRPDATLRLLINHNSTGLISSLYPRSDILLQGLDQKSGSFRPFHDSLG